MMSYFKEEIVYQLTDLERECKLSLYDNNTPFYMFAF